MDEKRHKFTESARFLPVGRARSNKHLFGLAENYFSYFSTKTYFVGTQKNRLNGTVFFERPKHMFELMDKKIITILLI